MLTNNLKKGTRILLAPFNWYGTLYDNAKGTTRMAEVEGDYTEIGSVYAHDILAYEDPTTGKWMTDIEYTPNQLKCKQMVRAMGF